MDLQPVLFGHPFPLTSGQADGLLAGTVPPIPAAIDLFHRNMPRFLDEKIKWRPKFVADPKSATPLSL